MNAFVLAELAERKVMEHNSGMVLGQTSLKPPFNAPDIIKQEEKHAAQFGVERDQYIAPLLTLGYQKTWLERMLHFGKGRGNGKASSRRIHAD